MNTMRNMLMLLTAMSVTSVAIQPAFANGCHRHRHHHHHHHHSGMNRGNGGSRGQNTQANQGARRNAPATAAPVTPAQ